MRVAVYCCLRLPLASATCTHAPCCSRTDSCEPNFGPPPERSWSLSGDGVTSSATGRWRVFDARRSSVRRWSTIHATATNAADNPTAITVQR